MAEPVVEINKDPRATIAPMKRFVAVDMNKTLRFMLRGTLFHPPPTTSALDIFQLPSTHDSRKQK
jgi:hypothetical protein